MVVDITNFFVNFFSFYFVSTVGIFNFLNVFQHNSFAVNPLKDVDLTVNTDFEDLLAFLGDSLEFVEQDKAFLFDAIFDFYSITGEFASVIGVELMVLKNLKKLPQSVNLAKFFYI
jgi:hypothetical protein